MYPCRRYKFAVKKVVFYSLFNRQAGSMAYVSAMVLTINIQKAALKQLSVNFKILRTDFKGNKPQEKNYFLSC